MKDNRMRSAIIYNLRKNRIMALDDILTIATGKNTFDDQGTIGAIFFEIIIDLFKARFIHISDTETEDYLRRYKGNTFSLSDGYDFANYLKYREDINTLHSIKISLTDYFFRIQDAIGFSITDIYEKASESKYFRTRPIWGEPDKKITCDVFVIMPFNDKLNPVYEDHISKICKNIGLDCKRADLILNVGSVVSDIWSLIYSAQIIICDCTGRNPNVFYELGIAHSLGKKTICITQNTDDIPFDIKHLRYIAYEYTPRGMINFENQLEKFIAIASSENIVEENEF